MNKNEEWARKRLPFKFRAKSALNNKANVVKRHPHSFVTFENFLFNVFGPPMLRLERSRWSPTGMYWKRNPDGRWLRINNEFMFVDKKEACLARLYLPAEFVTTSKTI